MAAPKDNKYYLLRSFDGRYYKYEDSDEFLKMCLEYFQLVDDNPILKKDFKGKDASEVTYKLQRPYTKGGLCIYLKISSDTLENYKKREDFLVIITHIEQIIRNQKFEGAAAGVFHNNIIARDLGLSDKSEVKQVETIEYKNVSKQFPDK